MADRLYAGNPADKAAEGPEQALPTNLADAAYEALCRPTMAQVEEAKNLTAWTTGSFAVGGAAFGGYLGSAAGALIGYEIGSAVSEDKLNKDENKCLREQSHNLGK
jgi:hypothetical protein